MLADLPSWLSVDFARNAAGVLAIVSVVVVLIVMFLVRSVATRVVAMLLLGGAVFGLLHYRTALENCDKNGCACKLLGENLKGGGCP